MPIIDILSLGIFHENLKQSSGVSRFATNCTKQEMIKKLGKELKALKLVKYLGNLLRLLHQITVHTNLSDSFINCWNI